MGFSAKPLLHPHARQDGRHQVRIRLTKHRVPIFLDAGFTVAAKNWNEKATRDGRNWIRSGEVDHKDLNQRLDGLLSTAYRLELDNPSLSAAEVRDLLVNRKAPLVPAPRAPDLVAFAQAYVRRRALVDKPSTVLFYHNATTHLATWRRGEPLPIAELTADHLTAFYQYLCAKPSVYAGTAADYLVKLNTIVRDATRQGLLPSHLNPFATYRSPKSPNKNPPVRPTEQQRLALLHFDLTQIPVGHHGTTYHASLAHCRNVWELQYLTWGSRFRDIALLRERDVRPDRISFMEAKTGKLKSVPRTALINAILVQYPPTGNPMAFVLPLIDHTHPCTADRPPLVQLEVLNSELRLRNHWVNRGLRVIANAAGIPGFTTHSARHMFAERLYAKTKDIRMVQKALGHFSLDITERYMAPLGYSALDAAVALAFQVE